MKVELAQTCLDNRKTRAHGFLVSCDAWLLSVNWMANKEELRLDPSHYFHYFKTIMAVGWTYGPYT